jgi:FkbM family methyltransferase
MILKLKFFVFRFLCNDFTGSLLQRLFRHSIPDIRWRGFRFSLPAKGVNKINVAAIFWGFYESSEIRMIRKFFDGNSDVVELGSSLGVVGSHIVSRLKPGKRLISVEANPLLVANIAGNLGRFAGPGVQFKVLNNAIGYQGGRAVMRISDDNTETRMIEKPGELSANDLEIDTITLSRIIETEGLSDFTLVCDIEGAEIGIIQSDPQSLKRCRHLFIELHTTSWEGRRFSPEELLSKLVGELGFQLISNHGPVCYLKK